MYQTLTEVFGDAFRTWRCEYLRTHIWAFQVTMAYIANAIVRKEIKLAKCIREFPESSPNAMMIYDIKLITEKIIEILSSSSSTTVTSGIRRASSDVIRSMTWRHKRSRSGKKKTIKKAFKYIREIMILFEQSKYVIL